MSKARRRAADGQAGLRPGRHHLAIICHHEPDPQARRLARSAGEAGHLTALSPGLLHDQIRHGNLTCINAGRPRLATRQHRNQALPRGRWITVPAAYRKQASNA